MVELCLDWPKLQNDSIYTCCQRDISAWVLKAVLYLLAEAPAGPSQASQVELFVRIVKILKICKQQNITSTLMLTIVFSIHSNFLILLSIWLVICRSNEFILQGKMCAPKRGFACPSTSDWYRARNLPMSV